MNQSVTFGNKPIIRKTKHGWQCKGRDYTAESNTPYYAWLLWAASVKNRYQDTQSKSLWH